MPPEFRSTSLAMTDEGQDRWSALRWALPASLLVHAVAGWLLIVGLPSFPNEPSKEQAIKVRLVPPPKPPKAKAPKQAEVPKQAKAAPEAKAPQPPPKTASAPPRLPVLQPVYQFGKEDSGPHRSANGNASADAATPSPNPPQQTPQKAAPDANTASDKGAGPLPALTVQKEEGHPAATARDPGATQPPGSNPPAPPKPEHDLKLKEVKTLFSRSATGSHEATSAMAGIPRGIRAGELCLTELRDQLLNDSPPYIPDMLPSYRLNEGTVLEVRKGAFRSFGQWFDLDFRCEIDGDAMKVLAFAYHVGDPIPRGEWAKRGLPSQ